MNILRLSTLSLTLAIAVMTLGYANVASAEPPDCTDPSSHPSCKDDDTGGKPKNDTSDCQIDFSVTFATDLFHRKYPIFGDSGSIVPYPDPDDSKDKSGGETGAGPGFRFDTNGKGPLESARDTRFLEINSVLVPGYGSKHVSGADFRFHLPSGGLDLCALEANTSGNVPMTLRFVDDGGTEWMLLYDCIFHDTNPIINMYSDDEISREQVIVTRNEGAAGGWTKGNTWTITGTDACLISGDNYATATPDLKSADLPADFEMTIEAQ